MQFIFKQTIIHYEWMPDGKVKELFGEYAERHEYSEGKHFSLDGVLEFYQEEKDHEAVEELEKFIIEHNLCLSAEVKWSW